MVSKLVTVLTIAAFLWNADSFADTKKQFPPKGGSDEVLLERDGPVPATATALGPGDSVGFATYDYGSNNSACHNIIVYDDGAIAIGRMADNVDASLRATYYTFSPDGSTWTVAWSPVESARSGWGNIAQFADVGGVEITTSHDNNLWNVDADRGAGTWTESNSVSGGIHVWPRLAAGGGVYAHSIGANAGGGAASGDIAYTRTPDAGASFDINNAFIFTSGISGADDYDIAANGSTVYAVIAPVNDGTVGVGGPDVILATSTDDGTTWTQEIIYDAPAEGELPEGEGALLPDGSCCIIVDPSGNPHVFWGNYIGVGDASNNPPTTFSDTIDAPIRHWSAATGITDVAYPIQDLSIGSAVGRNGNVATQPDAGVDSDGNIYVIYQQVIAELDPKGNNYEHVFATGSLDGGVTWSTPVDVTPGTGFDGAWCSMADHVDAYVHFVYNCDDTAGNAVQGNHASNQTAVMYHMVDKNTITSVREIGGGLPTTYAMAQNYPNPFNPSTRINYSVPKASFVTIKVYDMIGREVATLVNQEQTAGNYEVTFDAKNLANGTYFYRLKAGEFTSVRKMMLLK